MTGYVMLVQTCGTPACGETERRIAEATAYAEERDLDFYLDHMAAHRFRLPGRAGGVGAAEDGLRRIVATAGSAGIRAPALPELSRLLVRRGADDAEAVLDRRWTSPGAATPATSWPRALMAASSGPG